jgi:cytochrome b involved in lipid metabolism
MCSTDLTARELKCLLLNALQIYDVTKYLDDHPGGADVLLQATGTSL